MSPSIGICIPFYRGIPYLRRAIQSVLCQTAPWDRLIVCDDGPEPGVEALVRSHDDPRLEYVKNESRLGMVGNWNRCLDLARTDLVTLLHGDDELLPGYCQRMARAAEELPGAVAYFCRARIINEDGRSRFSFPDFFKKLLLPARAVPAVLEGESGLLALLRGNFIFCPTLCYSSKALAGRRFSPSWKFVQDFEMTTRLLLEGERLVGLPEELYAYRRHSESATSEYTISLLRFQEESQIFSHLEQRAREKGWGRAARRAHGKQIVKLQLGYWIARDLATLRLRGAWQKLCRWTQILGESGPGCAGDRGP